MVRRLADVVLATYLLDFRPLVHLSQDFDDLFYRASLFLHFSGWF
jgi:hypothetical protein